MSWVKDMKYSPFNPCILLAHNFLPFMKATILCARQYEPKRHVSLCEGEWSFPVDFW